MLAKNIKKHRKLSHITQNELAERLFVSPQSVSKWECGISVPELSKLCEIANMFNISVDELIGNSEFNFLENAFIAIDGGGTKTEFVLFKEDGSIIKRLILGGSNPTAYGLDVTCNVLKEGIDSLMNICPKVVGIYAGISGATGGDPDKRIPKFLKETYPRQKTKSNSDVLNVVASTVNPDENLDKCVAVICGTGSVAFTYDGDTQMRTGGWGNLLDSAGSGYDFGRDALCAALAERDELGGKTLITPMVEAKLGGTVWDNISEIYSREKGFIASFASIVFDAYSRGDEIASQIINKGTDRLAHLINRATRDLDEGSLVVISGGLMNYRDILLTQIKSKVNKKLNFVVPDLPQIYGASVLCAKLCGVTNSAFRDKFNSDYKKLI